MKVSTRVHGLRHYVKAEKEIVQKAKLALAVELDTRRLKAHDEWITWIQVKKDELRGAPYDLSPFIGVWSNDGECVPISENNIFSQQPSSASSKDKPTCKYNFCCGKPSELSKLPQPLKPQPTKVKSDIWEVINLDEDEIPPVPWDTRVLLWSYNCCYYCWCYL